MGENVQVPVRRPSTHLRSVHSSEEEVFQMSDRHSSVMMRSPTLPLTRHK